MLDNKINFEGNRVITGYTRRTEWVERTYYFAIEFNKPILSSERLDPRDPREKLRAISSHSICSPILL